MAESNDLLDDEENFVVLKPSVVLLCCCCGCGAAYDLVLERLDDDGVPRSLILILLSVITPPRWLCCPEVGANDGVDVDVDVDVDAYDGMCIFGR